MLTFDTSPFKALGPHKKAAAIITAAHNSIIKIEPARGWGGAHGVAGAGRGDGA